MTLLFVLFLALGALLIVLAQPMMTGRLAPNPYYGFRVRATLEEPRLWYPVNRLMGRWLAWSGALQMLVAGGLYFAGRLGLCALSLDAYALLCLVPGVGLSALGTWRSLRYMKALQKTLEGKQDG